MGINVYMFSARNGDCFLLEANKKYLLIDGGYYETYHNSLKETLTHIPRITLAIITHIDRDHIEGIIELFKRNGHSRKPEVIEIQQVWYNSYNHLPKKTARIKLSQEEKEILDGYLLPSTKKNDINQKAISGIQGMSLSYYLIANGFAWNSATKGISICKEHITSLKLDKYTTITLLTPTLKQLSNLAKTWEDELKQKKWTFNLTNDKSFNDAMEAFLLSASNQIDVLDTEISSNSDISIQELSLLSSSPDKSPTNASSISFFLQSQGTSLLFLSDAPEEQIIKALKDLSISYFDAIKLSHHGSLKNANTLFNYIDGEFFFISTDGSKHGHPDLSTLAKIIIRPCVKTRKLIFNYPNNAFQYFNNTAMMERYNYTIQLSVDSVPINIT